MMRTIGVALLLAAAVTTAASAQKLAPFGAAPNTFTATLSNNTPLVYGMGVDETEHALGTPLAHVSGRAGDEIFLTFRNLGGSGLFPHHDRLYLQFRKGRLAGWKGDWSENWMWK